MNESMILQGILPLVTLACLQGSPAARTVLEIQGVVTANGQAAAGAEVRLAYRRLPVDKGSSTAVRALVETRTKTDDDGRFSLPVPIGRKVSLYAVLGPRVSPFIDGVRAGTKDVRLALAEGTPFKGRFRYRRRPPGTALDFVLRRVVEKPGGVPFEFPGRSLADGSFEVGPLPPALWSLRLAANPKYRPAAPVAVRNDGQDITVPLARAVTLTGELVGGSKLGRAVGLATIELLDPAVFWTGHSDAAGRISIPGLEYGPGATILVDAAGWRHTVHTLEPGLSPEDPPPQFRLTLAPGREVKGRVLRPDGTPAAGLEVAFVGAVHPTGLPVEELSFTLETAPDGSFTCRRLDPAAAYDLWLLLPDGEAQMVRTIFAGHDPLDLGSIRIGAGRIRATIVRSRKNPNPPAELRVYGPKASGEWSKYRNLYPQPDGTWLSPTLPEGEFVLVAIARDHGLTRLPLTISRAADRPLVQEVKIGTASPRRIEGVVVDNDQHAVPGRKVLVVHGGMTSEGAFGDWTDIVIDLLADEFFPPKDYPRRAVTDKNGRFTVWCFEGSGAYDLIVLPEKRQPVEPLELPEDQLTRVDQVLGRPNPVRVQVLH